MTYLNAIILGIVQGLTEFLPVSSSGHLSILQYFFNIKGEEVVYFTILLHVGTLISVFIMYWKDIKDLIIELFITIKDLVTGKGLRMEERPVRKLGVMIIVATIPTAIIGLVFEDLFTSFYESLLAIGIGLLFTGTILWIAESVKPGNRKIEKLNIRTAVFIGIIQGLAICPGVSRSGSTLFSSLVSKLDRDFAVEFVFLISIPSILGSFVLELGKGGLGDLVASNFGPVAVGIILAAVSGVIAIKTMIAVVRKFTLKVFSVYVWIVGVLLIGYQLIAL